MPSIFISYAHVDNQLATGEANGWVTNLVTNIRQGVSRKIGRAENFELWMDFRLKGNTSVTPEIRNQLKQADVIVIFLSPGWIASPWCQEEFDLFCQFNENIENKVYVVEIDTIDKTEQPKYFNDLRKYKFWVKTEKERTKQFGWPVPLISDKNYYDLLAELSEDIAVELKIIINNDIDHQTETITVYVAPVLEPLYEQRKTLINELKQFNIKTIPTSNDLGLLKLSENMKRDLEICSCFIQLLDENYSLGLYADQYQLGTNSGLPIIQWRSKNLNLSTIENIKQRELLEGKNVVASSLTDFSKSVINLISEETNPEDKSFEEKNIKEMIFVHTGQQDFKLAELIAGKLRSIGYGIALPRYNGNSITIRKSIERGFQSCNILLMLYRETPVEVVDDFLSNAFLANQKDNRKIPLLVCKGINAEELHFTPPGLHLLNCQHQEFDQTCVTKFLEKFA